MGCDLRLLRSIYAVEICDRVPALPNGAALDKDVGSWRLLWHIGCAVAGLKEAAARAIQFVGEEAEDGDVYEVVDAWHALIRNEKRWRAWKEHVDKHLPRSIADLLTRDDIELFVRHYEGIDREGTDQ